MSDLTDQDDKAIRAIGLGVDNAGPDHPKWDGGWMPIETAPKDGAEILVYRPRQPNWQQEIFMVSWSDGDWCDIAGILLGPTHWMPLPQPPKEAK